MAAGCPEEFDVGFLHWTWNFNRRERPALVRWLASSGSHLTPVIFQRDADVDLFLSKL
jgi:hypothetical protein